MLSASSLVAGLTASVVESFVTYPLEYLKVREQIAIRPRSLTEKFAIPKTASVLYRGISPFVLGNASKTVTRFNVYNWATDFMTNGSRDRAGAPQLVAAGVVTGAVETLIIVPFENVKTTMIEKSALGKGKALGALPVPGSESAKKHVLHEKPREHHMPKGKRVVRPEASKGTAQRLYRVTEYEGMTATFRLMLRDRGIRSMVQGFNPTVFRQIANTSLKFTVYNMLRHVINPQNEPQSVMTTLGLAGVASLVQAVVTQPLDVIKSRMQTSNGLLLYGNSLICSYRIFIKEGPQRLWSGLLPRWLRIWSSGAIMWLVYEQTNVLFSNAVEKNLFKLD